MLSKVHFCYHVTLRSVFPANSHSQPYVLSFNDLWIQACSLVSTIRIKHQDQSSVAMSEQLQKRLTVTFKDVAVQVPSLTESYGSTVASVVMDIFKSFKRNSTPPRVISMQYSRDN